MDNWAFLGNLNSIPILGVLMDVSGLKGSHEILLSGTETLLVVIRSIIQFLNFSEKPRSIKHF